MEKQEREGRKFYNETAQNEVYDEEGRSKGMGKQKKEGRESDNETVQNEEEDEEGWDKEMKKRKEGRRHPSTEAAEASEKAAVEAESYQITVKANRSFANRTGAVTRSKLAIENRGQPFKPETYWDQPCAQQGVGTRSGIWSNFALDDAQDFNKFTLPETFLSSSSRWGFHLSLRSNMMPRNLPWLTFGITSSLTVSWSGSSFRVLLLNEMVKHLDTDMVISRREVPSHDGEQERAEHSALRYSNGDDPIDGIEWSSLSENLLGLRGEGCSTRDAMSICSLGYVQSASRGMSLPIIRAEPIH
ncbi:hypothetical protein OUZ56_012415 [Daphnia magna]|uniref:Uncharacterized protein n=1 Tax=Daphnia magna TaxID=35525 RepID=A0ABQ9Z341_9CRUS|nr:hypothetical protein OUZ56_012415 [Daphnia magna]